jgi:hypothetical protein
MTNPLLSDPGKNLSMRRRLMAIMLLYAVIGFMSAPRIWVMAVTVVWAVLLAVHVTVDRAWISALAKRLLLPVTGAWAASSAVSWGWAVATSGASAGNVSLARFGTVTVISMGIVVALYAGFDQSAAIYIGLSLIFTGAVASAMVEAIIRIGSMAGVGAGAMAFAGMITGALVGAGALSVAFLMILMIGVVPKASGSLSAFFLLATISLVGLSIGWLVYQIFPVLEWLQ